MPLDSDEEAAGAYGMIQCFTPDGPSRSASYLPWEPERLRAGNYIDAMAMTRASVLRRLGGFTTDRRLYGWEDYDLWCAMAENDQRLVMIPNFIGAYHVSRTSMLATSDIAHFNAFAALIERHPVLMAGVDPTAMTPGSSRRERILELAECPLCRGRLLAGSDRVCCAVCGTNFPVIEGVPVLTVDVDPRVVPPEHESFQLPNELVNELACLDGWWLHLGAGATSERVDNCVELEMNIFRNTDLVGDIAAPTPSFPMLRCGRGVQRVRAPRRSVGLGT